MDIQFRMETDINPEGKSYKDAEPWQQKKMEELLRQLKARLGTGGTIKDTCLEIQGDHCDTLMAVFEKMGYRPKRSGS